MVERDTKTILLYAVSDRSEGTLLPIIEMYIEKGATIYSDGWSAYCPLNDLGNNHFTVLHKYAFKKSYINKFTNEEVHVHTNRIEGALKHTKDHFRRMAGTKNSQFEGHLLMWRAEVKYNIFTGFFDQLRSIYTECASKVSLSYITFRLMDKAGRRIRIKSILGKLSQVCCFPLPLIGIF